MHSEAQYLKRPPGDHHLSMLDDPPSGLLFEGQGVVAYRQGYGVHSNPHRGETVGG